MLMMGFLRLVSAAVAVRCIGSWLLPTQLQSSDVLSKCNAQVDQAEWRLVLYVLRLQLEDLRAHGSAARSTLLNPAQPQQLMTLLRFDSRQASFCWARSTDRQTDRPLPKWSRRRRTIYYHQMDPIGCLCGCRCSIATGSGSRGISIYLCPHGTTLQLIARSYTSRLHQKKTTPTTSNCTPSPPPASLPVGQVSRALRSPALPFHAITPAIWAHLGHSHRPRRTCPPSPPSCSLQHHLEKALDRHRVSYVMLCYAMLSYAILPHDEDHRLQLSS